MLFLRAAFFALLGPGTVTIAIPWLLLRTGARPMPVGDFRFAGAFPLAIGAAALLGCILDFAIRGKGTLAPVDPPRNLVVRGLYGWVRNPVYLAVWLVLVGESILFRSWPILIEAGVTVVAMHLFVVGYEEGALRRKFGAEYEDYCARVGRWLPRRPRARCPKS
jgi:protein-S-isoprenylcysteine O-methyltransferase Ste14